MGETWFTGIADELARCLVDARDCAATCEAFLERVRESGDDESRRRALDATLAPTAVAGVLIELIDHPPQLVLAATRLLRETSETAVERLAALDHDASDATAALQRLVDSCERLLDAAGEPP